MSEDVIWKFRIDAFSPRTIPMKFLAEYLSDLAVVLGEPHAVHFEGLEGGSTSPVVRIEHEAEPTIIKRAHAVRMREGPQDAQKAKARIERRLIKHNAKNAELTDATGSRVLLFRGRERAQEIYGPVRQVGELVGCVIVIGGKNDPVPVHILDGEREYICEAKKDVALRLRTHLLTDQPIRATGFGRYFRSDQGEWEMQDFRISDFQPLDPAPLGAILERLRAVKSEWLDSDDPLARLRNEE